MKKKILIIALLFVINIVFAEDLTFDEIRNAYSDSYKHEAKEKYEKAINDLKDVYSSYQNTYTINYRLGWLYYLNGNYANSLEHLQEALTISVYSVEVLNTINLVYVIQEKWEKVEEQSAKIIKIDYYNFYANLRYSTALKMLAKYELAIKVDRKMLEIFPTSTTFLQELAENLFLSGEMVESRSIFESILILDTDNTVAPYYLEKYK